MRALAALRMVWASRRLGTLEVGWRKLAMEMLATWCVRKLRGDARPSPCGVLGVEFLLYFYCWL